MCAVGRQFPWLSPGPFQGFLLTPDPLLIPAFALYRYAIRVRRPVHAWRETGNRDLMRKPSKTPTDEDNNTQPFVRIRFHRDSL